MPSAKGDSKVASGLRTPEGRINAVESASSSPLTPDFKGAIDQLREQITEIEKAHPEERVYHSRFRNLRVQITAPLQRMLPDGTREMKKGLVAQFRRSPSNPSVGEFRVKPCDLHPEEREGCTNCFHKKVIERLDSQFQVRYERVQVEKPRLKDASGKDIGTDGAGYDYVMRPVGSPIEGPLYYNADAIQKNAKEVAINSAIDTLLDAPVELQNALLERLGIATAKFLKPAKPEGAGDEATDVSPNKES